ncbi:MAG: hypothetical protein LH606_19085 [Cytophagaceae bacterium]|nr:hypothetical protein [Cytophagaceae bacterium]
MKKLSLLLFALLSLTVAQAQRAPRGMNYQAVARDLKGQVLADQTISLRINLLSGNTKATLVHYSETHDVTTNQFGLFTLVIGEGKTQAGVFDRVPWSTDDVWMEVGIREANKSNFAIISSSKLLAVPYAFHAATAAELVGKSGNTAGAKGDVNRDQPGVVSQNWSVFGNMRTNPTRDFLGTTDYQDLVMITNNIERLRITKDGDINIANNLKVGKDLEVGNDLTVKQDVFLNTTGGATTINGITTITNTAESTGKTNGALVVVGGVGIGKNINVGGNGDVDGTLNVDGITTISNPTQSTSKTNGALVVVGGVGISKNINVGGNGDVDGTLNVDGATTINSTLNVSGITNISNTTQSTNTTTGALTVAGGVGISKNINIGGNASIGGNTSFGGKVNIIDATESTSTTTGALTVAGGVGIGKRINVGGAAQLNSTLGVDGATDLNSTLNVDGATTLNSTLNVIGVTNITNTTQSTLTTNGAFTVAGGVGIGKNINVGGTSNLNGQVTINAPLNGSDNSDASYPLRVKGSNQGVVIEVTGSRSNDNNFVTFRDATQIWGRIEGETVTELEASSEYKTQVALYVLEGVATLADIAGLGVEGVAIAATLIGIPAAVGIAAQALAVVIRAAALVTEAVTWSNNVHDNVGVSYASGNGDYAEWLERGQTEQDMSYGQIVGVRGGKLSLRTDQADHYMAVSKSPIVLGNMPVANREKDFEKVAFMGQVPVRVVGKVAIGDYIIPSGNHDGMGLAVHPAEMKLGDYARIVGVSWQEAKDAPLNLVNVAVGINANDLTSKMVAMSQKMDSLSQKTDNILAFLQGKAPLQTGNAVGGVPSGKVDKGNASAQAQTSLVKTLSDADFDRTIDKLSPQLTQYFGEAKAQLIAKGINPNANPYLAEFFKDPITSVKQLRRDPTMSTQWGRFDQQLQNKTKK